MIDAQTLQAVSVSLAALGFLMASTYYILTLRNQYRARQAQLFMQLYQRSITEEANRSWWEHVTMTWEDYDDFD